MPRASSAASATARANAGCVRATTTTKSVAINAVKRFVAERETERGVRGVDLAEMR
jgi:hypothetical protein